jgi:Fic family protein
MRNKIYSFVMNIDWKLINTISQIDRFDSNWAIIEKKESRILKQLKIRTIIKNIAASARIENHKITDEEVNILLQKYEANKFEGRNTNEITDYFEVMEVILKSFDSIAITGITLINIHTVLMRYKKKDRWFKGIYRLHNSSETMQQDVAKQILSPSANSEFSLTDGVKRLINWYNSDEEIHSLIKIAVFMYDFLSVFPFQDGNKKLSRLMTLLLFLKNGYHWIQYVSLEQEIEIRKEDYYRILRNCQSNSPNENITEWIFFFLNLLISLQEQLMESLKRSGIETRLSPREKAIIAVISNNPGCKSGEISIKLAIPNPTTKRILAGLLENGFIERYGKGRSTNYSIE